MSSSVAAAYLLRTLFQEDSMFVRTFFTIKIVTPTMELTSGGNRVPTIKLAEGLLKLPTQVVNGNDVQKKAFTQIKPLQAHTLFDVFRERASITPPNIKPIRLPPFPPPPRAARNNAAALAERYSYVKGDVIDKTWVVIEQMVPGKNGEVYRVSPVNGESVNFVLKMTKNSVNLATELEDESANYEDLEQKFEPEELTKTFDDLEEILQKHMRWIQSELRGINMRNLFTQRQHPYTTFTETEKFESDVIVHYIVLEVMHADSLWQFVQRNGIFYNEVQNGISYQVKLLQNVNDIKDVLKALLLTMTVLHVYGRMVHWDSHANNIFYLDKRAMFIDFGRSFNVDGGIPRHLEKYVDYLVLDKNIEKVFNPANKYSAESLFIYDFIYMIWKNIGLFHLFYREMIVKQLEAIVRDSAANKKDIHVEIFRLLDFDDDL
jgi:tRNA A-37 threonylcarbamoyl transferase component Bud32